MGVCMCIWAAGVQGLSGPPWANLRPKDNGFCDARRRQKKFGSN